VLDKRIKPSPEFELYDAHQPRPLGADTPLGHPLIGGNMPKVTKYSGVLDRLGSDSRGIYNVNNRTPRATLASLPRQAPPASHMEAIERQQIMLAHMAATSRRWEREGVIADRTKIMPTTTWAERMSAFSIKRARRSG